MDIAEKIKGIIFKIIIICLSLCTLLWFSIFSYGILYYLYIPAVAHIKPVHLKYDMSCIGGNLCKHPYDNITLIEEGDYEFLRGGQGYAVEVVLEMPESERNFNQGMFMIKLDMLDHSGGIIQSSLRPALLHYRSPLFKVMYTLFFMPGLLAGSLEEKQVLVIPLFEKYIEGSHSPTYFAHIQVQAQTVEVYSSTLRIHAQFTGLRYLMYYWPVSSAIVGIGSHFLFMLTTIMLIWLRETMKDADERLDQNLWQAQNIKKETRKPKKKQLQKPVGLIRDRTPETKHSRINKKEKVEIENLPTHRVYSFYPACQDKPKKEEDQEKTENQEEEENEEEYFDAKHFEIPSTSQDIAYNPGDFESPVVRQRIKQILGRKYSD